MAGRNGRAYAEALGILALGGAAGYVTGLLIAPSSGKETRRKLARRLEEERDDALRRVERIVDRTKARIEQAL